MDNKKMLVTAVNAMNKSYSPYSHFKVGASLLCKNGKIYTGCNIENASYSATVCAERVALFEAIKNGEAQLEGICVVGSKNGQITDYCHPCGVCLQTLSEFCHSDFEILLFNGTEFISYTLEDLLPESFGGNVL